MRHAAFKLGISCLVAVSTALACGVDDRPLAFEYHALQGAGSGGTPSSGGDDSSNGGDSAAGEVGATQGGIGSLPHPSVGDGGDTMTGEAGAGVSNGGSGSPSGGRPSGGSSAGGAPALGGSGGGKAGGGPEFPCGDLNVDGIDDCVQTLVQNSRFDASATGWSAEPSLTQAWDPSNASGKAGSGSLSLNNGVPPIQAVGAIAVGSRQCIPAAPDTTYELAVRVKLQTDQTAGSAAINLWLFDDVECQGNMIGGSAPISGGVPGKWTELRGTFWVPGGARSMYVRLLAIKPFTQPSLAVFVDDVLVLKK